MVEGTMPDVNEKFAMAGFHGPAWPLVISTSAVVADALPGVPFEGARTSTVYEPTPTS